MANSFIFVLVVLSEHLLMIVSYQSDRICFQISPEITYLQYHYQLYLMNIYRLY